MCNISPVQNWLIATLGMVVAAAGAVVTAAISNNSFWGAPGSVGIMITAGVLSAIVAAFLGFAISALNTFCACLMGRCAQACSNLKNLLAGASVVLSSQAGACFAAAFPGLIPWAGQGPMWVIAATLTIEIVLIVSALIMLNALSSCAQSGG